jgi:hypothetical protein
MRHRSIFVHALWIALSLSFSRAIALPPTGPLAPHHSPPYPSSNAYAGPAWFVDEGQAAGLTMLNVNGGVDTKKYIIETTGSGAAVIDYDNDGWPDIFIVNGTTLGARDGHTSTVPTGHLYHNNRDGTFSDVTRAAKIGETGWGQGACVGDYDNDGYDDLYITAYGVNLLFHNERNGTFKETAKEAGVAGDGHAWSTGCAFVDYDRDGKLDLVVATYVDFDVATAPQPGKGLMCIWKGTPVMCGPRGLGYTSNLLYHNLGGGEFEDVSKASGIQKTFGHYCFSISTLDFNEDGWPDIYIACDSTPSILYRNNKDGSFTDVAADSGVAFNEDGREQAGMGSTVGDYDGDGHFDIFKTNFSDDTSSLYRNMGDGVFESQIFQSGLSLNTQYLGWGVSFLDVDNDGRSDLLLVNGHVYPEVDTAHLGSAYREPRLFYWNAGNGKFKDLSAQCGPGCTKPASSRGLAIADFWNDGRISAVVNNMSSTPMLLVNLAPNTNHWLGVILRGTQSNRDGIGARVTLFVGQTRMVQEVRSGSSYLSSNDLRLHFGLGASTHVRSIEIRWPNGRTENFPGTDSDHFITVTEGLGEADASVKP